MSFRSTGFSPTVQLFPGNELSSVSKFLFPEQAHQGYQDFSAVRQQPTKFGHTGLRDGRVRGLPRAGGQPQVSSYNQIDSLIQMFWEYECNPSFEFVRGWLSQH